MPAIRPHSEYKKKFRWHDSVKSASFSPTKQQSAVTAGLSSFDAAKTYSNIREPALQHKKQTINAPRLTNITSQDFGNISPEEYNDSVKDHPVPLKPSLRQTSKGDEPRKFTNGASTSVLSKTSKKDKENDVNPNNIDNVPKPTHKERDVVNSNSGASKSPKKDKNEVNRAMQYQAGIRAPKFGGPKFSSEYQRQFAWKKPVIKESPLIAAEQMVYNSQANIAPYVPDKIQRSSEYQTQFKPWQLKTHHTNTEKLKRLAENEIKAKYRLKTKKKKKKRLSPDKMAAAGVPSTIVHEDPSLLKKVQNPQVPFFPHASFKKWKSEYRSNFKAPDKFNYESGVWKGADPPQIQPRDDTSAREKITKNDKASQPVVDNNVPNWFDEVSELRNRAKEYKKRARGTHFSREHLAQLLAEQAKLWDQTDNGNDGHQENIGTNEQAMAPAGKPSNKDDVILHVPTSKGDADNQSPVRRKLAWNEKNDQNSNNNENNSSIGSIPTPTGLRDSASSSSIVDIIDENGRVTTPDLPEKGIKQRHHFDRTTPSTGGALLTSPQPTRRDVISSPVHKDPLSNQPIYKPSNRTYAIDKSPSRYAKGSGRPGLTYVKGHNQDHGSGDESDDDDITPVKMTEFQSKTAKVPKPLAASPTAGVRSRDPDPLNDDLSEHSFNRHSNNYFETSARMKHIQGTRAPPSTWAAPRQHKDQPRPSTTEGPLDQPNTGSIQGRPLTAMPKSRKQARAEDFPSDDASSVSSARQARGKLAAKSNKTSVPRPEAPRAWSIPTNEDIHPSLGVSKLDDSPASDQMSMSDISSVSSCSLASDILDRARKRRDKFWGK
ncbi:nuclear protein MDM1-like [Anneissia japonica]|uniref:nuclear protein MDM1-like n=1 Tax=Anneissia japonica TaxID=1529436 RepID=UPI001425A16D|nr:nuclear protein MDM1-like [Anneissia japonica]